MVEIATSILTMKKGEEANTILNLEAAKTDYFHIDVMDGKFVQKDTYQRMLENASYIKRVSNLPLDVHFMVEDIKTAIQDFADLEPNVMTFHLEACKDKETVKKYIKMIKRVKEVFCMCVINIDIQTENDLYFAITNTILSLDRDVFTVDYVISVLKSHNITEDIPIVKGRLRRSVEICIQNLIEHGKVIEEPRKYQLAK